MVGKVFWDKTLHYVGRDEEKMRADTSALLSVLENRELIQAAPSSRFEGAAQYEFRHAILHEVVYESVLLSHRHRFHRRVAEWLIHSSFDRVSELAGLVGDHYLRAERHTDAVHWFATAAHHDRETYLPNVAIDYYVKALGLYERRVAAKDEPGSEAGNEAEDRGKRQLLYYHLGEMCYWQTKFDEAIEALHIADQLAAKSDDNFRRTQTWSLLGRIYRTKGAPEKVLESAEKATEFALKANSAQGLVVAMVVKIGALFFLERFEDGSALCQEALPLSQTTGLQNETAQIIMYLGSMQFSHREYAKGIQLLQEALQIYQALGDRRMSIQVLNNIVFIYVSKGEYAQAEPIARAALHECMELGDQAIQLVLLLNLGLINNMLGQYEEAVDCLQRAFEIGRGNDSRFKAEAYRVLAEGLLGQGRVNEAQDAAVEALRIAQEQARPSHLGAIWRTLGMIGTTKSEHNVRTSGHSTNYGQVANNGTGGDSFSWTPDECFAKSAEIFRKTGINTDLARTLRAWANHQPKAEGWWHPCPCGKKPDLFSYNLAGNSK